MTKPEICAICKGKGTVKSPSGKRIPCRNCSGDGLVVEEKGPPPEEPPKDK